MTKIIPTTNSMKDHAVTPKLMVPKNRDWVVGLPILFDASLLAVLTHEDIILEPTIKDILAKDCDAFSNLGFYMAQFSNVGLLIDGCVIGNLQSQEWWRRS